MRGLMIGAPASGSGKTMLTCGLLRLLQRKQLAPVAFKCGPDYIDPMFHRQVLGVDSENLDSFFAGEQQLRQLVADRLLQPGCREKIGIVEGVMGYYDGLGGISLRGSSWEIAHLLKLPVILVVNGRGASRSLAAVIQGFLNYQPGASQIGGVILNRVSAGLYGILKEQLEKELSVPLLGYVPELSWMKLESRHLGLVLPEEIPQLQEQLLRLSEELEQTLDLPGLLQAASGWSLSEEDILEDRYPGKCQPGQTGIEKGETFRLAVARDSAFCFYYEENLKLLQRLGAELAYFSPLRDKSLPEGACGLLLGGGYPELYAGELSANRELRSQIAQSAEDGLPILAECGGYLYLLEELESADGAFYPMAGVFQGRGCREKRLRQFGYVNISGEEDQLYLKKGNEIRGHEFHYWHCSADRKENVLRAEKPVGGRFWPAMRRKQMVLAGFPHLYYPSCPEFAENFALACLGRKHRKEEENDS